MPNLLNHFHEMVQYNLVHLFETLLPRLLHGRQTLMEKQMTCTKRKVCISLKVCTGNTFPTRLEVKAWKFFFISVDLVDSGVK